MTNRVQPCSTLVIAIQWKLHGAIGGMSQRFLLYSVDAYERGLDVRCLTSWSLANHMGLADHPALICVDDRKLRPLNALLKGLTLGAGILGGKFRRVHLAGGGQLGNLLMRVARGRAGISVTFASRTLEMAAYGNERAVARWRILLDAADRIDVLNPGHDLIEWNDKISVSPCSFPARLVGKEITLREKEQLLVFSGALEPTKNPLLAIEIVQAARRINKNIRLVIFGAGSLRAECEARAVKVNREFGSEVIMFGEQDHYFTTLARASVFLSLQDHDNYPSQSLMEAMRFGCRCICTADGDTRLMFPRSNDNFSINSRDSGDFVEACAAMSSIVEPSSSNAMHIMENFTLRKFSSYFDDFLGSPILPSMVGKSSAFKRIRHGN